MRAASTKVLAGLFLVSCATPALAQLNLSAATGGLHYTVTDLDPGDGIAPQATFTAPPTYELAGRLQVSPVGEAGWERDNTLYVSVPTALAWDHGANRTGASFDGHGVVAAGSTGPQSSDTVWISALGRYSVRYFTLTPHTRITFTLDAALDLTVAGGIDSNALGSGDVYLDLVYSNKGSSSGLPNPLGDIIQGKVGFLDGEGVFHDSVHLNRTLVVTWDNNGAADDTAFVSYEAHVDGNTVVVPNVPAVPEPRAWAMLLLGCSVLGVRGRKCMRL
jgi:hypothetical protein